MKKATIFLTLILAICAAAGFSWNARGASDDNAQINALYQQFTTAFRRKDVTGIMAVYEPGPNLFVFDVTTPRQHVGSDSYKADWKDTFASVKDSSIPSFGISDLNVTISGDVAYSHSIQHLSATMTKSGHMSLTVRVTDVLRKINGKWLIVQEHVSVPIDFNTMKPDFMSRP